MQDAINMWYRCRSNHSYEFRDKCYSVRCHDSCPEDIDFYVTSVTPYPDWSIILIICIVVTFTLVSIFVKVCKQKCSNELVVILFAHDRFYFVCGKQSFLRNKIYIWRE